MQKNTVNHAKTTTMSTLRKSGGTPCTMQEAQRVPNRRNTVYQPRGTVHQAGGNCRTMQEAQRGPCRRTRCTMQEIATWQEKVLNMRGKSALRTSPKLGIQHFQALSLTRVYGYVVQCRAGYLGGFVPWTNWLKTNQTNKVNHGNHQESEANALRRRYIHFNSLFPWRFRHHQYRLQCRNMLVNIHNSLDNDDLTRLWLNEHEVFPSNNINIQQQIINNLISPSISPAMPSQCATQ